jgi:membrane fusion protein, multidrug efflux system
MGKKKTILLVVAIVAIAFGAGFIYEHLNYVTTDNASVQAHSLMIAPKVGGVITKVYVNENENVVKGQPLAEIDNRDYLNTFNQVKAQVESLKAKSMDASHNLNRMKKLFEEKVISPQQFEDSQAKFRELSQSVIAAEAQLQQASLNLEYTKLVAPSDGSIAKRSVEVGMTVPPGQPLFGFVSSEGRWVTANFKETDLANLKPGLKVKVKVDAIPSKDFFGEIESISSST